MFRTSLAQPAFVAWGAFAQESTLHKALGTVTLQARDILYVPDNNNKKKNTTLWLDRIAGFGSATAAGAIIYRH
ncbi:MAG TPA: hypothetical protein VKB79_05420 [Bryobacteraceae bacterium]|nr:hypothetical protein [Bryobacteraceae bacterium]